MEGQGADENNIMGFFGGDNFDHAAFMDQLKVDGYESRSGSENFEGGSGDEVDVDHINEDVQDQPTKKKKYHRHTPQQIQQLES